MSLPYQYSVHCLSDGSEYTDKTLLLTVKRGTTFMQRYALTGLTSLSARLAADQRVPLHTIRASFGGTTGLPSLLLALSQAGAADLTICGPADHDTVETITALILGPRRSHPLVRTCQVPNDGLWYQVYQDEYLRAHGKFVGEQIVWIYTLLRMRSNSNSTELSLAVIPTNVMEAALQPLPQDVVPILDCILFLQKTYRSSAGTRFYYTDPTLADDWLLTRAVRQAQRLAAALPFAVSFRRSGTTTRQRNDNQLTTGSSLCLDDWTVMGPTLRTSLPDECKDGNSVAAKDDDSPGIKAFTPDESLLKEMKAVWSGQPSKDDNEIDLDDDNNDDDNEIDLDEDDQQKNAQHDLPLVSYLLILGTGCASPSALRGSSAYAIFTPQTDNSTSLTALLDCGEGTLTNLHRHLPDSLGPLEYQLTQIKFIWISHAHLDHYGGLSDLIIAIHTARCSASSSQTQHNNGNSNTTTTKVRKTNIEDSLIVIAPFKVLSFLSASLRGHQQQKQLQRGDMYRGVTHREFEVSPLARNLRDRVTPTCVLRSIPVEHCAQAHAILLEFPHDGFRLVYSGDTRPSANLVRAARAVHNGRTTASLLLHEATFDDDPRGIKEALEKRHSTVLEALEVSRQMQAKACLLTHFSQRYPNSPPGWDEQGESAAAFAVDGMWLPLTDVAVAKLPALSNLMQQILFE